MLQHTDGHFSSVSNYALSSVDEDTIRLMWLYYLSAICSLRHKADEQADYTGSYEGTIIWHHHTDRRWLYSLCRYIVAIDFSVHDKERGSHVITGPQGVPWWDLLSVNTQKIRWCSEYSEHHLHCYWGPCFSRLPVPASSSMVAFFWEENMRIQKLLFNTSFVDSRQHIAFPDGSTFWLISTIRNHHRHKICIVACLYLRGRCATHLLFWFQNSRCKHMCLGEY